MSQNKCFGATLLTGGTIDALDYIDGLLISNGDMAFVKYGGNVYMYNANTGSGATEASPNIISPDTNAGTTRWVLQGVSAYITQTEFIPIANAIDGTSAPDVLAPVTQTNGVVNARTFAVSEDVRIPWSVPADIYTTDGVKFQVLCVVTHATGPTNEGIEFGISGYSIGHGDPLTGTFGTAVTSSKTAMTEIQYDILFTVLSDACVITSLAAGELAMLKFIRNTPSSSYGQVIGVIGVRLVYTRLISK